MSLSPFELDKKRRKAERYQIRKHRSKEPNCEGCYRLADDEYPIIHHLKPISQKGSWRDGLITLCQGCHRDIHTVNGHFSYRHVNEDLTELYRLKIACR